jgi:hypothetical protein
VKIVRNLSPAFPLAGQVQERSGVGRIAMEIGGGEHEVLTASIAATPFNAMTLGAGTPAT